MQSFLISMMRLKVSNQTIFVVGFSDEGLALSCARHWNLALVLGDFDHVTPFWVASFEDACALIAGGYELAPDSPWPPEH